MSVIDKFRSWNRKRIAKKRLSKPSQMTPFGFKLKAIAEMQDGGFEPQETALVRSLLNRTDRFINVGANMGIYCCFAAQKNVPTIAFEPIPENVSFIMQNLQENNWSDRVTILPVGAGESAGIVEIYGVGTGSSMVEGWANNPSNLKQSVPVVALNDCIAPPTTDQRSFILMDI